MDQETLVINRIAEARKLIDFLAVEQQLVVSDAFWIEDLESDEWSLRLSSSKIDEIGLLEGIGAIIRVLRAHPEIPLENNGRIRPDRPDDPVVVEVCDFLRRYPAAEAFRLTGVFLKGHFVQRAYVYPVLLDGKSGSEIMGVSLGVG